MAADAEAAAQAALAGPPDVIVALGAAEGELRDLLDPLDLRTGPPLFAAAELDDAPEDEEHGEVRRLRALLDRAALERRARDLESALAALTVGRRRDLDSLQVEMLRRLALAAEYRDDNTREHTERVADARGAPRPAARALRSRRHAHPPRGAAARRRQDRHPGLDPAQARAALRRPSSRSSRPTPRPVRACSPTRTRSCSRWPRASPAPTTSAGTARAIPTRLAGEAIPLVGRLVHVADVFDVLVHERPVQGRVQRRGRRPGDRGRRRLAVRPGDRRGVHRPRRSRLARRAGRLRRLNTPNACRRALKFWARPRDKEACVPRALPLISALLAAASLALAGCGSAGGPAGPTAPGAKPSGRRHPQPRRDRRAPRRRGDRRRAAGACASCRPAARSTRPPCAAPPSHRDGVAAGDACADADAAAHRRQPRHASPRRRSACSTASAPTAASPSCVSTTACSAPRSITATTWSQHLYFAHVGRDGSQPAQRIRASGYLSSGGAWRIGENLAWGSGELATPKKIMAAWMGSPGHRANILQPAYREIGFGVIAGNPSSRGGGGATYVTEFGVVARPRQPASSHERVRRPAAAPLRCSPPRSRPRRARRARARSARRARAAPRRPRPRRARPALAPRPRRQRPRRARRLG